MSPNGVALDGRRFMFFLGLDLCGGGLSCSPCPGALATAGAAATLMFALTLLLLLLLVEGGGSVDTDVFAGAVGA